MSRPDTSPAAGQTEPLGSRLIADVVPTTAELDSEFKRQKEAELKGNPSRLTIGAITIGSQSDR